MQVDALHAQPHPAIYEFCKQQFNSECEPVKGSGGLREGHRLWLGCDCGNQSRAVNFRLMPKNRSGTIRQGEGLTYPDVAGDCEGLLCC